MSTLKYRETRPCHTGDVSTLMESVFLSFPLTSDLYDLPWLVCISLWFKTDSRATEWLEAKSRELMLLYKIIIGLYLAVLSTS